MVHPFMVRYGLLCDILAAQREPRNHVGIARVPVAAGDRRQSGERRKEHTVHTSQSVMLSRAAKESRITLGLCV